MRPALTLIASLLVTGCATPAEPAPEEVVVGELGDDCAIIAAVAKEYFQFGPDNPPPPVRFEADYDPRCDWSRHGLAFARYDESAPSGGRVRPWVRFHQPRYDDEGAVIEVGIMHGPLAGQGSECRVYSGFAGWMVGGCRRTWVS
ncbi:hypothetical protein [Brevundimonas sp.]|uniref:hypothetical protein n=1 Tax=Brevundimonas sp. TaxID=1871086 RepID=UPI002FCBDE76